MTHDYKRNGTTDLFAALNVGTGEVLHQACRSHTSKDVLAFFRWIDLHVPRDQEIHIVLDNLSAHKSKEVKAWLAKPAQRRWHLHFTPTSSSCVSCQGFGRISLISKLGVWGSALPVWTSAGRFQEIASWGRMWL